jgi:DNA repair protein RecN (Recombination protein N)
MLRELRIQNFAIIDDLRISFGHGLNAITGETGSGKSMIIGALTLLAGGRADTDVVRRDCDASSIEALFDHPEPGTALDAFGLGADDDLLVRRLIPHSGKGRVHINGSPTTVALLADLGARLIHLYGQHDQALLLHPETHLEFLDAFGAAAPLRAQMAEAFAALASARATLQKLHELRAHQRERRDLLAFQLDELTNAAVEIGEEERLRQDRERLRHAERLHQVCTTAEAALYSDEPAIVTTLARFSTQLRDAAAIDTTFTEPHELLATAQMQLEEVALQLRRHANQLHADPDRLAAIDERLALLTRLSRKYRVTADELPPLLEGLQRDMVSVDNVDAECAVAAAEVTARQDAALAVAQKLSAARARTARELGTQMDGELTTLGMAGAKFSAVCTTPAGDDRAAQLDAKGFDRIEFHLAANIGEPPKPLARVASGGELSRIMLALKALTARISETPILIFDEVDAGIGGAVADAVARRLHALSRTRQLLCITHLPQIAAYADHHFAVEKRQVRGRTIAQARALDDDERVRELTRMLGGAVAPSEAERYAQRLLDQARTEEAPRRVRRAVRP